MAYRHPTQTAPHLPPRNAMQRQDSPTVPDIAMSSVSVPKSQCMVGSVVNILLELRAKQGNPMCGPGIMSSVDAIVTTPSGKTARLEFPVQVPVGGKCTTRFTLTSVGTYTVSVKVCGKDIRHSPVRCWGMIRGSLVKAYNPPMNQPHDILQRENVYVVADKGAHQIQVFDREFRPANKFCSPDFADGGKFDPYAIAWTGETFVVTDLNNHCVVEFKNFVPFRIFGQETLKKPTGIAAGKNDHVYVADAKSNSIFVFDQRRECVSIIGGAGSNPGQLHDPWYMAMNSQGNLVVAEFKNKRVQIFNTKNNKPVRIIDVKHAGKAWDCRGLALDRSDNIYVTVRCGVMRGFSTETVLVYTPTGDFLGKFGEGFNYVRGLTVSQDGDRTLVYVVDGANHRIVTYEM